jgi:hypothetical protein
MEHTSIWSRVRARQTRPTAAHYGFMDRRGLHTLTLHRSGAAFSCALLLMTACHPAEKVSTADDPYMIRMDFLERKLAELRDTTDRRLQDERTRRENQLAIGDKSVRELETRLNNLESRIAQLEARLSDLESPPAKPPERPPQPDGPIGRVASEPAPPLPPTASKTAGDAFPLEISDITPLVITVRTQTSVRVIETGRVTRDEAGRRIPEVKTETYPIYEYEYRLQFDASHRTVRTLNFQAEAGYGPMLFSLPPGGALTKKQVRWKAGASLMIRADGQYRLFDAPPPPPPSP